MFEKRREWKRRRFGDMKVTGKIEDVKEITWPDIVKEYAVSGKILIYHLVKDIEKSAKRIAEIFRNAADEMVGNSELEWHHDANEIISRVKTGEWGIYGCCVGNELASVSSLHAIRGQRAVQWVYGCVDPDYRRLGIWHHMSQYLDIVVEKSGAQMGFLWVVTSHKYSQMSVEAAGYIPMGFFPGWSFYGGSDGYYYRPNMILYGKVYDRSCLQEMETMQLTEKAGEVVEAIRRFL